MREPMAHREPPAKDDPRAELAELTLGLTAGRAEAWDQLYRLTHLPILRYITARLNAGAAASAPAPAQAPEDLLQAVYVTAIQSIRRFDAHKGTVDMWLLGIAKHKLQESRRQSARAAQLRSLDAAAGAAGFAVANAAAASSADTDESDIVALALDAIEPRYAEVLRRKYIAGETLEAIAFALGFKSTTVGSWLHRGREQFRKAYLRLAREPVAAGAARAGAAEA